MFAFKPTEKFPVNMVFGCPVQVNTMSPTRSVKPSARTTGGTALVTQIAAGWARSDRADANKRRKKG
jgi:hypothetical protein